MPMAMLRVPDAVAPLKVPPSDPPKAIAAMPVDEAPARLPLALPIAIALYCVVVGPVPPAALPAEPRAMAPVEPVATFEPAPMAIL